LFKKDIRAPIAALFLISLGGLLLHLRIHPPQKSAFNWLPVIAGIATTLVLPVLFNYRKTVAWAYLLNLAVVIVGTVTMAWWSATNWRGEVTVTTLVLNSTLADILVLLAKLPLAQQILRHFRPKHQDADASCQGAPDE